MRKHVWSISLLVTLLLVFGGASARPVAAQTGGCDTTGTVDGSATPTSATAGDTIIFRATGFTVGEAVSFYFTLPNGRVVGTANPVPNGVNPDGSVGPLPLPIDQSFLQFPGVWALTFNGATSHHISIIKFCITP